MNVLLADFDLFRSVGGGQTFYRSIILQHPHIDFYYLRKSEPEDVNRPVNAHPIDYTAAYPNPADEPADLTPPRWTFNAFQMASNIAYSVAGRSFDVVDLPDYWQYGIYLGPALEQHGVSFGRIALSMHGRISRTMAMGWLSDGSAPLSVQELETLQYAAADTRYFISEDYRDEWRAVNGLASCIIDPTWFFKFGRCKPYQGRPEAPDVNFVGRSEKLKGAQLFIQLVWWTPRSAYRQACVIGPHEIFPGGETSTSRLKALDDLRRGDVQFHRCMTPTELAALFASKSVTVLPSLYDTLNLTALESLFSGCPTMIGSGAGVCRYLRERFPEIPFEVFDLKDLYANVLRLEAMLRDYERGREQLEMALAKVNLEPRGPCLEDAYVSPPAPDPAVRVQLDQWYGELQSRHEPMGDGVSQPRLRLAV